VKIHKVDEVQILSPIRKKGRCGVNQLNKEIQKALNPQTEAKLEIFVGDTKFRPFDKITQLRNFGELSNGDVGRIRKIVKGKGEDYQVIIDFGNGRIVAYGSEEMEFIDLAYATTIHKSQGSEYQVVIIPLLSEATKMLQRNLIYTAITRAKTRVVIVGEKAALYRSIHKTDTVRRNTVLGHLIAQ